RVDKKQLYQNIFRTPEYFWFHPYTLEFQGFRLSKDMIYEPILDTNGMKWSNALQMYLGIHSNKLRFYSQDGKLIPTPAESAKMEHEQAEIERKRADIERRNAEKEHEQAEIERKRADIERKRAEALAAKLQELGIDPTTISI
ncbi:hypothetical protein TI05_02650, partial [Achromatium sp. WMS3]